MTSLKDILDELDIDTSDLDGDDKGGEKEIKLSDIKLDDFPEAQRPIVKKLTDTIEGLTNDVARGELIFKTLKDTLPSLIKNQGNQRVISDSKEEKVLGILDSEDQYAPMFKALADKIDGITVTAETNKEEQFKTDVVTFAQKNKDIVRFATDMDQLRRDLKDDSPLKYNVPRLYELAKNIGGRREDKVTEKKGDLDRQSNASRYRTESSGISNQNVEGIKNAGSIKEAFDFAEDSLSKR